MIHTVFSTTDTPYMNWQSELLEYTWKQVEQPGELVRLVATDSDKLPKHRYAQVVRTRPWHVHPLTNDGYPIYNKPASLYEWLKREVPEGTILFLDPDCIFRAAVDREVAPGHPVSQAWIEHHHQVCLYTPAMDATFPVIDRFCRCHRDLVQGVMIPTLIHTSDMKRMVVRWLELTGDIRQEARNHAGKPLWESDMFAYIIAAAEHGLIHEPAHLGICTNWSPVDVPNAPIVHYCQAILGMNDEILWAKGNYQPWDRVGSNQPTKHDYGRDVIDTLNRFIEQRELNAVG